MEYKKLKLEDLINKAGEHRQSKNKTLEIYVKSFDGIFKMQKPSNALLLESLDIASEDAHEGDIHLIYNSVIEPNLKSEELQESYGVARPVEIVDELFDLGEIKAVATILAESAGYGKDVACLVESKDLIEDVKN